MLHVEKLRIFQLELYEILHVWYELNNETSHLLEFPNSNFLDSS